MKYWILPAVVLLTWFLAVISTFHGMCEARFDQKACILKKGHEGCHSPGGSPDPSLVIRIVQRGNECWAFAEEAAPITDPSKIPHRPKAARYWP